MTLTSAVPFTTTSSFVWGMTADTPGLAPTGTVKLVEAEATNPNFHASPATVSDSSSARRVVCISMRWARSAPQDTGDVVGHFAMDLATGFTSGDKSR